jgi:erythromycin esterase
MTKYKNLHIFFLTLILIFQIQIAPETNAIKIENTETLEHIFGCSIEINGFVLSINTIMNIPIGEKNFILDLSVPYIDIYDVTVKIDDEVINFDSGGKIEVIGFFGMYSAEEENGNSKTFVSLNGRAIYVKIEQYDEVDDSFISIVESLDIITHKLDKSPLNLSDEDLESLEYLSDCKIAGLGEATHGTKEFFQLKHRIFRYLVENHDYKIFAFECDMGESYYVDKYVTTGEGNIDYIMINIMHFWTWMTKEVKDLLIWMKEYNQDKSDKDKIHFIGVDCQFLTYQADIITDYFNNANISLSQDILYFLNEIKQINPMVIFDYYSDITLDEKEEININADILLEKIEESKNELVSTSSEYEYQFIKRIVLNIKQVNNFYYKYINKNIIERDYYMAENALWTSNLFGENTKVALWAHNMHNMNNGNLYGVGSMGFYLKEELSDNYQIIDFAFSFGSFTAIGRKHGVNFLGTNYITREPKFGSINYVLHYAEDDNFILRESDIPANSSFDVWISESQDFLDIGAVFNGNSYIYYHPVDFKEQYDVVIYWDVTSASELLQYQTHNCCSNIIFPNFS